MVVKTVLGKENIAKISPKFKVAGHWWLVSVILAIQEAEIRRIVVQSQTRQIVRETLSQKNPSQKKDWWSDSRCRP
jgi:hypothetical protein